MDHFEEFRLLNSGNSLINPCYSSNPPTKTKIPNSWRAKCFREDDYFLARYLPNKLIE